MKEDRRNKRIGAMLRKARKQAGVSQDDAANFIGVTTASFSRMETGGSMVTAARLERLAEHYGVSMAGLFDGELVAEPSAGDIDRVRFVVEAVQNVVNRIRVRPSPAKMGLAVSELYRLELDRLANNPGDTFDPVRHTKIIEAIFRK